MARYYGDWAPYMPVAERRRHATLTVTKLRKKGLAVAPVTLEGRTIATTFWGRAWCDMMESYGDYASRLPRGRSYVRSGSVIDLQIETGRVTALVSGSELYTVTITIKETAKARWRALCAECGSGIDTVIELLQGRIPKRVMERFCDEGTGLFPQPSEIRFSCSCPDHASMCKHVAAVLYGVGARLDQKPELLFRLRAVDETELVARIDTALPRSTSVPKTSKILAADDMAAMFGLDMAEDEPSGSPGNKSKVAKSRAATEPTAVAKTKGPPLRAVPHTKRIAVADRTKAKVSVLKAADAKKTTAGVKRVTTKLAASSGPKSRS
jgi:uncharacterized Zn finger protein